MTWSVMALGALALMGSAIGLIGPHHHDGDLIDANCPLCMFQLSSSAIFQSERYGRPSDCLMSFPLPAAIRAVPASRELAYPGVYPNAPPRW